MSKNDTKTEVETSRGISKEDLTEAMTAAVLAAQQVNNPKPSADLVQAAAQSKQQCGECGQKKSGCGGRHRKTVVFPKNSRYGRHWQGIRINGILYDSGNSSTLITVPADADIEYMIHKWEEQEQILVTGRKAEHDSGSIGKSGRGTRAAHAAWR